MYRHSVACVIGLGIVVAGVVYARAQTVYEWTLPDRFPIPSVPPDNPMTDDLTKEPKDVGRFKAPTLRNIAVTAPYMHDGSVATLEDAIEHYAADGRTVQTGPYQGVGRDNPNKSASIRGFTITPDQRADLAAFLQALTDQALLEDPRFANPWPTIQQGAK